MKFAYLTIFVISLFLVLTDAGRMRAIKCTEDAVCVHALSKLNLEYCPPPNRPFCSNGECYCRMYRNPFGFSSLKYM
ncbi:hypothetical protein P8452_43918 [Trifolium repens]|nr:hypothetical protein P8452_43916 [Trifolium repens]WJX58468.1 hypothetical protein P8452_43918 [Trifolium repens]